MAKSKSGVSTKRIQIDKAKANMVLFVAVAAFITVFSLVSSKALFDKRSFQARVIGEKRATLDTLKANNDAAEKLITAYTAFNSTPDNLLGGVPNGSGDRDGTNAALILDALPARYDFPGLTSSIEKMIASQGGSLETITGTDDEIAQAQSSDSSQPIEIPFAIDAKSSPDGIQNILRTFGRSIRPMVITRLHLSVEDGSTMRANISAKSYYQPQKTLEITTKEVR